MQAVVLVGGEGTRLRPLTFGTPKPMVPVMNVPFLERTLRRLKDAGHRRRDPARRLPARGDHRAISATAAARAARSRYVIEETPLGTAGALKNVAALHHRPVLRPQRRRPHEPRPARDAAPITSAKGGIGSLHLIRVEDPSAFGCVVHDARRPHHRVRREAAERNEAPTNEVNAGTYLLEARGPRLHSRRPAGLDRARNISAADRGGQTRSTHTPPTTIGSIFGNPQAYLASHRHIFDGTMPLGLRP